jgi:hypothetical protein
MWPAVNSVLVVFFSLMLCRCFSVFGGEQMVSVCQVSMMACRFMGASLVVLRRLPMMSGRVFVVFSGFVVMLRAFMLRHFVLSYPRLREYA